MHLHHWRKMTCLTAGIEALLDLPPLYRTVLNKAMETRMLTFGKDRETSITENDKVALIGEFPICEKPLDSIEKKRPGGNPIEVHLGSKATFKNEKEYKIKPGTILWYTDESLTSESTGAGVCGPRTSSPNGENPNFPNSDNRKR